MNRLESDLHEHFSRQLTKLVNDTADTCGRAGIDPPTIISMVLSVLMYEVLRATHCMGIEKRAFLILCGQAYTRMEKVLAQPEVQKND